MSTFILLVYLKTFHSPVITMQEFESQATCQAAGTKIWELSGREALWSCMKK